MGNLKGGSGRSVPDFQVAWGVAQPRLSHHIHHYSHSHYHCQSSSAKSDRHQRLNHIPISFHTHRHHHISSNNLHHLIDLPADSSTAHSISSSGRQLREWEYIILTLNLANTKRPPDPNTLPSLASPFTEPSSSIIRNGI